MASDEEILKTEGITSDGMTAGGKGGIFDRCKRALVRARDDEREKARELYGATYEQRYTLLKEAFDMGKAEGAKEERDRLAKELFDEPSKGTGVAEFIANDLDNRMESEFEKGKQFVLDNYADFKFLKEIQTMWYEKGIAEGLEEAKKVEQEFNDLIDSHINQPPEECEEDCSLCELLELGKHLGREEFSCNICEATNPGLPTCKHMEKIASLEKEWKEADFWAWAWYETTVWQTRRIQDLEKEIEELKRYNTCCLRCQIKNENTRLRDVLNGYLNDEPKAEGDIEDDKIAREYLYTLITFLVKKREIAKQVLEE